MIDFRPIRFEDVNIIKRSLPQGIPLNCDWGFVNLIGWSFLYKTEMAISDNMLLVRFFVNGHLSYMLPVGTGDFNDALNKLQADADSLGQSLMLFGALMQDKKLLENSRLGYFKFLADRDVSDYIYLRSDLTNLKGKKLQSKRNHANRFALQYPEYRYVNLTEEIVPDCLKMENCWLESKAGKERQAIENERKMVQYVLNHLKDLDVIGGALYVGEKIVAFTFGSMINDVTFDVCAEKANSDFEGSYAMINKEFCTHLPERFIYINREEDLGIEGLRKAKLSYQPKIILEKMTVIPICNDSLCWEVKRLYQLSFDDDSAFVEFYFAHRYSFENTVTESRDDRIVSAMQILDYSIDTLGCTYEVGYISAACTLEGYRGKGLMSHLLQKACNKMFTDCKTLSTLVPANEKMWAYYGKFGYVPCFTRTTSRYIMNPHNETVRDFISIVGSDGFDDKLYDFFSMKMKERKNYIQHDISDFQTVVDYYNTFGGVVLVALRNENIVGIIFAEKDLNDNNLLKVEECLYDDDSVLNRLLNNACVSLKCEIAEYPAMTDDKSVKKGMIRIINAKHVLKGFCDSNPDQNLSIHLVDDIIKENNFFCKMNVGECQFLENADSDEYEEISVSQLASLIFGDLNCRMTLMID